tara:strand:- start:1028 stop:1501 length:474 start_codon:yes stop_codon:yes gene_type:complete
MENIEKNLIKYKIKIPETIKPIANYNPFIFANNLVFISGQIPIQDGKIIYTGKVGKDLEIETAKKASELCMLNSFAVLKDAVNGNLLCIKKCIKITVFINSTQSFIEQPSVADGASDLIKKIMNPNGQHARSAVSSNALPKDSAVEIESLFEVDLDR